MDVTIGAAFPWPLHWTACGRASRGAERKSQVSKLLSVGQEAEKRVMSVMSVRGVAPFPQAADSPIRHSCFDPSFRPGQPGVAEVKANGQTPKNDRTTNKQDSKKSVNSLSAPDRSYQRKGAEDRDEADKEVTKEPACRTHRD